MKVIDILNKIANGEEVRFRIVGDDGIYHWFKGEYMIFENTGKEEQWYIDNGWLNNEVEIIEEDKKIEKLDISDGISVVNCAYKINEIIDYLNKEKK